MKMKKIPNFQYFRIRNSENYPIFQIGSFKNIKIKYFECAQKQKVSDI